MSFHHSSHGLDTPRGEDWRKRAACRDEDPTIFHPSGESTRRVGLPLVDQRTAKKVCWTKCAVRTSCLKWALETGEPHGIVGGLAEHERSRLSLRLRIIPTTLPLGRRLDLLLGIHRCKAGHVMTRLTTIVRRAQGRPDWWQCRACDRMRAAAHRQAVSA